MAIKIVDTSNVIKANARYEATCECCHAVIQYLGRDVAYHRNFPKGFVYCPNCRRPIPHLEENRCEKDATPEEIKQLDEQEMKKGLGATFIVAIALLALIVGATLIGLYLGGVLR